MLKRLRFFMLYFVLTYCFSVPYAIAYKSESIAATLNGALATASFSSEVIDINRSKNGNVFDVTDNLEVLAEIKIDPAHIGKLGYIYVAVYYEQQWYMKTADGKWLPWQSPYAIEALFVNKGPKPLMNIEKIDIAKGFYGFVGSYQVYFGYQVDKTIHYNDTPLKFVVQRKLNDTGQVTCSNGTQQGLPCSVLDFPGQDANYGRDASVVLGGLVKKGNGLGAFDFTKIAENGTELPDNASEWACVKDNVTGLLWEVKNDNGQLHDKDWLFTWYEPNAKNNGGYQGVSQKPSDTCGNISACNTSDFVIRVNQAGWCGRNNWRMPVVDELTGIANLGQFNPAIDQFYFKYTHSFLGALYWTATPVSSNFRYAWTVDFFIGQNNWHEKSELYFVRLVSESFGLSNN